MEFRWFNPVRNSPVTAWSIRDPGDTVKRRCRGPLSRWAGEGQGEGTGPCGASRTPPTYNLLKNQSPKQLNPSFPSFKIMSMMGICLDVETWW